VVQIVDARNPLLFRSEDLESYVKHVDPRKENLLLVNKADMLTVEQRQAWADYFEEAGIAYKFFSASLAKEMNESRDIAEEDGQEEPEVHNDSDAEEQALAKGTRNLDIEDEESSVDDSENEEERTRILTVDQLEELFLQHAPGNQGTIMEYSDTLNLLTT
jgi:large subunit GTPase 1